MAGDVTARRASAKAWCPPLMLGSALRRAIRPRSASSSASRFDRRTEPEKDIVTRVAEGEVARRPAEDRAGGRAATVGHRRRGSTAAHTLPAVRNHAADPAGDRWLLALLLLAVRLLVARADPAASAAASSATGLFTTVGKPVGLAARRPPAIRRRREQVRRASPPDPRSSMRCRSARTSRSPIPCGGDPRRADHPPEGVGTDSAELARYKDGTAGRPLPTDKAACGKARCDPTSPSTWSVAGELFAATRSRAAAARQVPAADPDPARGSPTSSARHSREVMAYPEFDTPMYQLLLEDLGTSSSCPTCNLIPQNTITPARDQPAVHRGLHGRAEPRVRARAAVARVPDRPARQQLPAVLGRHGVLDPPARTEATAAREAARHPAAAHAGRAPPSSATTTTASSPATSEDEVVLVIRGELLKRYPTAVIYAHAAAWQTKPTAASTPRKERVLVDSTAAEEADPPRAMVKTPLYEAKVEPDIYFFGFDLTATEAQGGAARSPTTIRAGSSSSRSVPANRASASTSNARPGQAWRLGAIWPGQTSPWTPTTGFLDRAASPCAERTPRQRRAPRAMGG